MSKGNPIIPTRFPPELLAEVDETVERSHQTRTGEPWTRTAFILTAVREKLKKMKRSNKGRPAKGRRVRKADRRAERQEGGNHAG